MYDRLEKAASRFRTAFVWGVLRILMGWMFLWAFLDKTFGLGYATAPSGAWINGGSPTAGFLKFGSSGLFEGFYQGLAGNQIVDALFMGALLLLGMALVLGIGQKVSGYMGGLFVLLLWSANVPPANNPLVDQHIIYLFLLIGLSKVRAGRTLGLGRRWAETVLVRRYPMLE